MSKAPKIILIRNGRKLAAVNPGKADRAAREAERRTRAEGRKGGKK